MRLFLPTIVFLLSAGCLAQSYQEGVLALPGPEPAKAPEQVKVKIWSSGTTARVEMGDLVLMLDDSAKNPAFELGDRTTGEAVLINSDAASIPVLAQWEALIFPLLPNHAGFAETWPEFNAALSPLLSNADARLSQGFSRTTGLQTVSYYIRQSGIQGMVTWGYTSSDNSDQMVDWSFLPDHGLIRTLHLGKGEINDGVQKFSYGDSTSQPTAFTPVALSTLTLTNGQLSLSSGSFKNVSDATQWLLERSVYQSAE